MKKKEKLVAYRIPVKHSEKYIYMKSYRVAAPVIMRIQMYMFSIFCGIYHTHEK